MNRSQLHKESITTVLLLVSVFQLTLAQQFLNGGLEAEGMMPGQVPEFWEQVEWNDPLNSSAINQNLHSDILDPEGPSASTGSFGNPYEGSTFVGSGMAVQDNDDVHQEGIKQTVYGLAQGQSYLINFHQCVVRSTVTNDSSGKWQVSKDSTLIGQSETTWSTLDYLDPELEWEGRTLSFVATSDAHEIFFMALDNDDNSHLNQDEAVSMGIDAISLEPCPYEQPELQQEGNTWFVEGNELENLEWYDCETDSLVETGADFTITTPGYYMLAATMNECVFEWPCIAYGVVNTEEIAPPRVDIFPNPVVDQLTIDLRRAGQSNVKIMTASGRNVLETTINDGANVLDISELEAGLYLVEVVARGQRSIERVIKH